ncbi:hypothetical protein BH23GEM9_BH23GEM9_17100 [soil metagenome]
MRRAILPVIAFAIVAAPAALEAQTPRAERTDRAHSAGHFGAFGMAAGNPAARVLEHREALGLSLDQVRRLQQLQAQVEQRNQPLLDQVREARPAMAGGMRRGAEVTPEQREQMRERMQQRGAQISPGQREEMRERMQQPQISPGQREQMRERMQQRGAQVSPEQRAGMEARREQMRQATPEQRELLRQEMRGQMKQRVEQATPEQREQLRQRRGDGPAGLRPSGPRQASPEMRAQMEALRPVLEQLRESTEQARRDVQAVLTAEQQAQLRQLHTERAGERPAAGRRGAARR